MPDSSNSPTIDLKPAAEAPTLTRVGGDVPPLEAPANFAPPGYDIVAELGRGGMGVVYKALQKSLGRFVALKVILGAGHAGEAALARFRAEATTAAQLQHPNIVQVFEVGEHDGQPFFSLELVEGGSLADRLKGEPQPPRDAAHLVRALALTVQYAHERGIVHRDLKPANILLPKTEDHGPRTGDGEVTSVLGPWSSLLSLKITDFGLAKLQTTESHITQSGAILGTPSYMAPEQAAGDGKAVGPAADIYALGAILYEALTGRPPFKAASVMDTVMQVLHDDPIPPSRLEPKLPRDLETICLKCLAKKPEQRYPSAAALADDLGRFLAGESILARPTSLLVKSWKWARRHPARAAILFILSVPLPLLLGVVVYLWADARTERAAAVRARDEANRERELSQGYLKNALGTMDRIVERVGDERLVRIPAMQEERNAILAEAVAFYETLLRLDSSDPAVRHNTAETYNRVARLGLMAGRTKESARAAQAAIDLFQSLADQYPARPEYRDDLANSYLFLGHSQVLNADFAAGLASYQKGADLAEDLANEFPSQPGYKATAAECRRSLGYYFMVANAAEAEGHFKAAVALGEDILRTDPDRAEYKVLLASILGAYSQFLVARNRRAEADPLIERGMALYAVPRNNLPRTGPSRSHRDQAEITLRNAAATADLMTGRWDRARTQLQETTARYEDLMAAQPQSFPYRLQAVNTYSAYARLLERAKKYADAEKASTRAVELYDEMIRDFPVFRETKAAWFYNQRSAALVTHEALLVRLGKTAEAERMAADADSADSLTGANAYNLACLFALLAGAADGPAKDAHAARAMTWLRKGAATGYPATPAQLANVRTGDEDLAALRPRPDFQEWAKTLKPAKK